MPLILPQSGFSGFLNSLLGRSSEKSKVGFELNDCRTAVQYSPTETFTKAPSFFSWKCFNLYVYLIQVYKCLKDWFRLLFIFVLDEIRLEKWLVLHERELVLLSNVEGTVLLQNVKQVLLAKSWSWFTIILCNQEAAFAQKWVGIQIRTLLSIFNLTLFSHLSKTHFLNRP